MDEEALERVCAAIESAAAEAEAHKNDLGFAFFNDIVVELHQAFGSYQEDGRANDFELDSQLWEDVASKRVPLGLVAQGLAGAMEKGGCQAMMAADVFLGMLLSPGCPIYSLFSSLAFLALIRCIRNSCRRSVGGSADNVDKNNSSERPRKGQKKKGKRAGRHRDGEDDDNNNNNFDGRGDDVDAEEAGSSQSRRDTVSVQDVLHALNRLELVLNVLNLKDYQESLKSLVELLVEIPNLVCDFPGGEVSAEKLPRGPRARKITGKASASVPSSTGVCFRMMHKILRPNHGNPTATGVTLLKALSPSIMLLQPCGSVQQRSRIRSHALEFITEGMVGIDGQSVRKVVVAFPRYLSTKAPEKTDVRALAVEAVVMILRVLSSSEQRNFGEFVVKMSRGKPRYRLMAVDLAVALLEGLPDPLGLDRKAGVEDESCPMEDQLQDVGCFAAQEDDSQAVSEMNRGQQEATEEVAEESQLEDPEDGRSARVDCQSKTSELNVQTTESIWWGVKCLEALLHRCSDKVPAIRARALSNMAQALELLSTDMKHRAHLQGLLGFGGAGAKMGHRLNAQPSTSSEPFNPDRRSPSLGSQTPSPEANADGLGATPITPGVGHRDLGLLLRRRCMDDKVAVRKAALILMTKSTALLGKPPDDAMLQSMGAACADPMVSIKKAALSALSEVFRKFPTERVISEWLQSVTPLVMDNESSVQEECLSLFQELVLDRIITIASQNASGRQSKISDISASRNPEQEMEILFPQGVLPLLKGMSDGDVASCVKRICMSLGKKGRLRAGVARALQNIITTSESLTLRHSVPIAKWTAPPGAWLLLSEVSAFVPKAVNWEFLLHHWQLLDHPEKSNDVSQGTPYNTPTKHGVDNGCKETESMSIAWAADRVFLLQTISNVSMELHPDAAADLAVDLLERLEGFNMHPTEVGAHVKALITLCKRKAGTSEEGNHLIIAWVDQLLAKSEEVLEDYISKSSDADKNDSFQTPELTSKTRSRVKQRGKMKLTSSDLSSLSMQVVTAIFTIGALVLVCPAAKLGRLVPLLQAIVTSKKSKGDGTVHTRALLAKQVEPAVYTQAWVTLGKICLADDKLAKSCIPLFVQELEKTDSPAVRNNIMVAMTDFCVRYTALVDCYIAKLTKSLRDPCELVRRQAFVLLARLLQRDYVKWKGMLFHRFLLALVDESEKIRQLADFLFGSILRTKAPLLAYNSFVEAIFVLNDCHAHAGHSESLQTPESERHLFSLRGNHEAVSSKRMHIYVSLLKQMAPEHLLATSAKLCAEILAAAADGLLDLDDASAQCVLQDALQILACKEMRIQGNRAFGGVADNVELDEDSGPAAFAAAKGRVVTQIAKKNLVQNAIPIFIELKRLLESKNSPLTGCLMECLRMILKEYKNEIDEILVADKQLQKELLYDIQKFEAMKTKSKVAAAVATVQESVPQQVPNTSNDNVGAKVATSVQKSRSVGPKSLAKSPVSRNKFSKGKGTDKENANLQGAPSVVLKPSAMKRKAFFSPGVEKAAAGRVKWIDQVSGHNVGTPEAPTRTPRIVPSNSQAGYTPNASGPTRTPRIVPSNSQAGYTPNALGPTEGNMLSPNNVPLSSRHKIASAVADVAAAATVTAVLREVATGSSTPLHSMSIPRLKPSVPTTRKARVSVENSTGLVNPLELEGQDGLQSAQRRQSFSDID